MSKMHLLASLHFNCNVRLSSVPNLQLSFAGLPQELFKVVAVVLGGDGSLSRLAFDMSRAQIDLSKLLFTVLPFGTGNDIGQWLNWGSKNRCKTLLRNTLRKNA